MKKYYITEQEYEKVNNLSKQNKNKNVDRRLRVIMLRYEGLNDKEIAEKTGYSTKRVSLLCSEFCQKGAEEYARMKYGGNHRSLTEEDENRIIENFRKEAEKGVVVTVREIKNALDEKRGSESGSGYVYMLLKRHGWRKVMPRSKHPNKASDEVIAASKKLTPW